MGLVFLDEFDKIIMPERTSTGENPNLLVQYHILTMIEGATISCEVERGIKKEINTHKLMYVGMGSFDYFREEKKKDTSSIGFGLSSNVIEHYEPITREEIIKAGGCYELIGRFTLIVNYDELTTKAINGIIDKYIDELQKTYNCELVVRKNYREMLHNIANGDFGCRLIRNTLADSLIELYAKALNEVSDITQKKLVIKLSANNSAYSWRALTDQERKSNEELESVKYMELYEGIVDDSLPNV